MGLCIHYSNFCLKNKTVYHVGVPNIQHITRHCDEPQTASVLSRRSNDIQRIETERAIVHGNRELIRFWGYVVVKDIDNVIRAILCALEVEPPSKEN